MYSIDQIPAFSDWKIQISTDHVSGLVEENRSMSVCSSTWSNRELAHLSLLYSNTENRIATFVTALLVNDDTVSRSNETISTSQTVERAGV